MRAFKDFTVCKFLFVLICILSVHNSYADHLKGGWIKYTYVRSLNGQAQYLITFYQYSDCSEPEKVDTSIYMAIYDAGSNSKLYVAEIAMTDLKTEEKNKFGPCFQNPPDVCYLIASYTANISVPENSAGYVLAVQRCCRIEGINNVIPFSDTLGLTYTVTIPGGSNRVDNSPVFDFDDTVAVCFNAPFTLDMGARDMDGDSLSYMLCDGLIGASTVVLIEKDPKPPPYKSIPYLSPYTGAQPLGATITIDSRTGFVSGTAPFQTGTYVLAVCVNEFRNGVYIAHTRKEIHLEVENCKLGGANLKPEYINCNGFDFRFSNENPDNPNFTYFWDFGIPGVSTDTSSLAHPVFTYTDTGDYFVKLRVSNSLGCTDSATAHLKIYPGFLTDFAIDGSCIFNPYNFTDRTTTRYGFVDSWRWNFGESASSIDSIQNPAYTYPTTGIKTISLITTNSKGCVDTATKDLNVSTGPDVTLKFADTLICSIDSLRLESFSSINGASFNWSPQYNIVGSSTGRPLVFPKQTTTYNLTVSYRGCVTNDSVLVNVLDQVSLKLPNDTTICQTDSIQLIPNTDGLYFTWSPQIGLSDVSAKEPFAKPLTNTKYSLLASVGKCKAQDEMNVRVVPYPVSDAGLDAVICYGKTVQLKAAIKGSAFSWSPLNSLLDANSLTPVAGPQSTTSYILRVTDTLGCPKPVDDTVIVNVIPKVQAFAGHDTIIVKNQPLQLNASGGITYQWTPVTYLSNAFIPDPVLTLPGGVDTVSYRVKVSTPEGCIGYDSLNIYVFETVPQIFVPNAFTPNHDGLNDLLRPTVAGMKQFLYFRIFNRWGQLLYSTSDPGRAWDGTYAGEKQASGTYVYSAAAIDYTGHVYQLKGTVVLIR